MVVRIYQPTRGIGPLEMEAIESVFLDEKKGPIDKAASRFLIFNESAVLAPGGRIFPATQWDEHFDRRLSLLQRRNSFVEIVFQVGGRIWLGHH